MLVKIAWRNVLRNKRRSVIVISSVALGVVAMIFMDGLSNGMLRQMLFNQVNSGVSHIQIHKKGFSDNKSVKSFIPDYHKAENIVRNNPAVKFYSKRVITFGLLSSASGSSGVYVEGVIPQEEQNVTSIKNSIVQGSYLQGGGREIVIGKLLAGKLGVGVGDKVVAMVNTPDGSAASDVFRVSGIYETFSSEFDRIHIYIPLEMSQKMLGIGDNIYEIAMILKDYNNAEKVKTEISSALNGDYETLSYRELLPMLTIQLDMYGESMIIINFIIGLALIFGIINVMLMAVFERIKEFGVLISIGMKTSRLFGMILLEAVIIGIVGSIVGVIIGILLVAPFSYAGINFSLFAAGLKSWGVGAVIYPEATVQNIITLLIMIPFISAAGALYPAYRAVKLEPVYAMRYI